MALFLLYIVLDISIYSIRALKVYEKNLMVKNSPICYVGLLYISPEAARPIMTSQWLLKVPPCLRSRDWEFRTRAILIHSAYLG